MTGQLLLGLSILVVLHEFGHFITARMFGIKVEKFYLFFDAWNIKLLKIKIKDTEYGIGWLPFGGYVKIAGMIDESMDVEQMKQPPQPWEFRSKPAWQRLIVMLGGVILNAVLGIIIFSFMLKGYTKNYLPIEEVNKDGIYAFHLARDIGFKTGDKIISINDKPVERFDDVISLNVLFGSDIEVERDGQIVNIAVPDTLYKMYKKEYKLFLEAYNYPFTIDSIIKGDNAEKAGIIKNDKIISINNTDINTYGEVKEIITSHRLDTLDLRIQRNDSVLMVNVVVDSNGTIGFLASKPNYKLKDYTFSSSFKFGTTDAFNVIITNIKGLGKIFSGPPLDPVWWLP